jgi:predicted nucleic acid-binding protein
VRNVLIDAGPLIALFAADDAHHARYDRLVAEAAVEGLRLVTTWPCVVEASYILDAPLRFELLEWIERGGVQVFPFDASHLGVMLPWMRRHSEKYKRDMDLADASLLWLAHESGLREIMTVDVKDFARYRLPGGAALVLL